MISINYRRAKISSESIDCSNGYDLKNGLTAGAAVVVNIPSDNGCMPVIDVYHNSEKRTLPF